MRRRLFLLLLACTSVAGQTTPSNQPAGWKTTFTDDFEDGDADGWAVNVWSGEGAGWSVIKDGANSVFSGRGHSTAGWTVGRWPDFRFKARIKLIRGGLFVSYRTNNCDRYFLDIQAGALVLNRSYPCGTSYRVASASASLTPGQWYTLELTGVGANVKVYLDGVQRLDASEASPLLFGGVALEAHPDSQVYVDDAEISGPATYALADQLEWVKTGGPAGGLGYDVRMRPDNPDHIYVTDAFSGVNLSTDGGQTWRASNSGILARSGSTGSAIPIFSLTIDPSDPEVIWAGTQNQRGIYKSTDGGRTWKPKEKGVAERSGISFRGFTVDPRDSHTVYAAAEIQSELWAGKTQVCWTGAAMSKGVVYRTTDGGENWTPVWRGDALARYVIVDPRDSQVLYISTGIFDVAPANCDPNGTFYGGAGIVKSVDGGKSWQALGAAQGLTTGTIGSLFLHPRNPDILLAGGGGPPSAGDSGVHLSTDAGRSWTKTLSTWSTVTAVEFSVSHPEIAYVANSGSVYRSQDGGRTWTMVDDYPYGPPGIRAGVPIDMQVDPRNPDRLFVNNYNGGNFLSEDGGRTWVVASRGYTGAQMHKVVVDSGDPLWVYAVGRSGIFRSFDGGDHWEGLHYLPGWFGEFGSVALDPGRGQRVLLSPENEGAVMLSQDGGRSWETAFRHPGIPQRELHYREGQGFLAMAFAPSNPSVVYAGMSRSRRSVDEGWQDPSYGVFKSTDGGVTWQAANDANTESENVNVLAVDPRNENTVYIGTCTGGVFRTTDGGRSWRAINNGLRLRDVRTLAVDPSNSAVLYAGLKNGGIYKSLNSGGQWQPASSGMDPQASVRDILADPSEPQVLYAADLRSGVYRSSDGGKLWVDINKGLTTRAVKSLGISADGTTLYAATDGEGVFRMAVKARGETTVRGVSAASFDASAPVAPESMVSLFGQGLAPRTEASPGLPLPVSLAGVSVDVLDSMGALRTATLFFVSPVQINLLLPRGTRPGTAGVRVLRQGQVIARGQIEVDTTAPGLFTANADGKGVPAALALRVRADGSQRQEPVFRCGATAGSCTPALIDLGGEGEQVVLLLFGTGIRGYQSAVQVRIGGVEAPALYAGPQSEYSGLDQLNVRLPRELRGRGEVDVRLTADGKTANVVTIRVP